MANLFTTWIGDEAPDSSTLAGRASPGRLYLRRGSPYGVYQNQGSRETPNWVDISGGGSAPIALTWAAPVVIDASLGTNFKLTVPENNVLTDVAISRINAQPSPHQIKLEVYNPSEVFVRAQPDGGFLGDTTIFVASGNSSYAEYVALQDGHYYQRIQFRGDNFYVYHAAGLKVGYAGGFEAYSDGRIVGRNLRLYETEAGGNIYSGVATLGAGGEVVIATTAAVAGMRVHTTTELVGGTPGIIYWDPADTADYTSFKVKSTDAADRSRFYWTIHYPAEL